MFEELKEGDKVSFEVVQGEKGPAAVNVSRM
jgi:cold shock CspA family protein